MGVTHLNKRIWQMVKVLHSYQSYFFSPFDGILTQTLQVQYFNFCMVGNM